jgi:predicted alpha/beta-fold hydrolase
MDFQGVIINEPVGPPVSDAQVREFLSRVSSTFGEKPFKAHSVFSGGHAQTLGAYAWPRRYRFQRFSKLDEGRLFEVEPGVQILAHCRWQPRPTESPTVILWHGIEGSTASVYMISTADKAFRAGYNVLRVNFRNCGGTGHLTPTLYHGGLSGDLKAIINELVTSDGLNRIYPIGFSLGGNVVLKLAGEFGEAPPRQLAAICAISPSVDLAASTELILQKRNWLYHGNFVRNLKRKVRAKHKLFPGRYDLTKLSAVRTLRDFDEHFTSTSNGFINADDYYYRCSSTRVVEQIRVPTLIIHSEDDPFIPFEPLREKVFAENPYVLLLKTERGGHVAFIASKTTGEDRFWAENRAVEFCRLVERWLVDYF